MAQAYDHRRRVEGLELVRTAAVRRLQACLPVVEEEGAHHAARSWLQRAIGALNTSPLLADRVREAWWCVLHLPTVRLHEFQYARLAVRELLVLVLCCTRPGFIAFDDADTVLAAIQPPGGLEFPPASAFGLGGLQGVMQALAAAARLSRAGGVCPSFCRKAFVIHDEQAIAAIQACYELVTLLSRSA